MQNQRTSTPEFGPGNASKSSTADVQPFPSPARPKIDPRRTRGCIAIASKTQPDDSQRPDIASERGFGAAPRSRICWTSISVAWRADLGPMRGAKSVPGLFGERVVCSNKRTFGILHPSYALASASHPGRTPKMLQTRLSDTTNAELTHVNTGAWARNCTKFINR